MRWFVTTKCILNWKKNWTNQIACCSAIRRDFIFEGSVKLENVVFLLPLMSVLFMYLIIVEFKCWCFCRHIAIVCFFLKSHNIVLKKMRWRKQMKWSMEGGTHIFIIYQFVVVRTDTVINLLKIWYKHLVVWQLKCN